VLGVDAVPDLIAQAQAAGGAAYRVSSYATIAQGSLADQGPFDLIVSNFSLFGQVSVEDLLRYLPQLLTPAGHLVVQTLHPRAGGADQPYRDGWHTGSWRGFSTDFVNPAPWYFRTLSGWVRLLVGSGFALEDVLEPVHPQTQQPASLILVGTPVGGMPINQP
jgi:2-polyprenyl-3-methyl-5-hydroxy-6-metoxy-1,4-benzoquinol methylase